MFKKKHVLSMREFSWEERHFNELVIGFDGFLVFS